MKRTLNWAEIEVNLRVKMAPGAKEKFKSGLKLALGICLVVYVLKSRMIDFKLLSTVLFNPLNLSLGLIFLAASATLCAGRWYLLVRAQGLHMSFKNIFSLTMIGSFFNTFMPGSVGGDLIKAWYVAGQEPKQKTRAIFTVLLDRVIGLSVIIFYAALTLFFYISWLPSHPELQIVAYSIWLFTFTSFIFLILFFAPFFGRLSMTAPLLNSLKRWRIVANILESALLYRHQGRVILLSLLFSALSILGINLLYSVQGASLAIPMTLSQYFFVVPIALVASAIPLLPGGIGTGQFAFYTLFVWMGIPNPEQGGTLCTIVQIYTILFSCFGGVFYLRYKRQSHGAKLPQAVSFSTV